MVRITTLLLLLCASCSAPQPKSMRAVAAVEVPLPSASDKSDFLALLSAEAAVHGYHVDAASSDELRQLSTVSQITMNATVWRDEDEEAIASAMDFRDRIGRVWLTFSEGEEPEKSAHFRRALLGRIHQRWPGALSLPIMQNGAIPLTSDLVRTSSGYEVKPSAAIKYEKLGAARREADLPNDR